MTDIVVDIEADGPIPGDYSMVSFAAVVVEPSLQRTFKGTLKPILDKFVPEALAVSGYTREQTLTFERAEEVMVKFNRWLNSVKGGTNDRLFFYSDNNGFDWMFICWYFHHFLGHNPFGWSSANINSLYKGFMKNMRTNCHHLRKTKHTHDPLDDAMGNAEALLEIKKNMNF